MRKLHRFLRLRLSDQCLLVEAALLLGLVRLGLRVLSFRTLWRLVTRFSGRVPWAPGTASFQADRITWAVSITSPYVLGVRPCLAQALAAQLLLVRRGLPALLRVGVTRVGQGPVQAHAWMETDGRVVVGGPRSELERYTPLLALESRTR
jgi:transglutaminase superfamily protein